MITMWKKSSVVLRRGNIIIILKNLKNNFM